MDHFGIAGYGVFFGILEIYAREFKPDSEWKLRVPLGFVARKLRISSTKLKQMLNFFTKWQINYDDNLLEIYIPKFTELLDDWTSRHTAKLRSYSVVAPKKLHAEEEEEEEEEKEKEKEKKSAQKCAAPSPKQKYLDSVFLTENEYARLKETMGQKNLDELIEQLDYSITVKSGKYKDHNKTLHNWFKRGYHNSNGKYVDHSGDNGSEKPVILFKQEGDPFAEEMAAYKRGELK